MIQSWTRLHRKITNKKLRPISVATSKTSSMIKFYAKCKVCMPVQLVMTKGGRREGDTPLIALNPLDIFIPIKRR